MRIEESSLQLSARHDWQRQVVVERETRFSFGEMFVASQAATVDRAQAERERLARLLQSLIDTMLAAIDGKPGKSCPCLAVDRQAPAAGTAEAPGRVIEWQATERVAMIEHEATAVCAVGQVRTADGRCLDFRLDLQLARRTVSEQQTSSAGQMVLKDPLVLSFPGQAVELAERRFRFDLDADGRLDSLPQLAAGSGFLVFDRNDNGRADDGRELFGALSGDGFADLAALDGDGNGWVDAGDAAFTRLGVWTGEGMQSLAAAGIGALATAAVDALFSFRAGDGGLLGQLRSVGVYLSEQGRVGALQHVDLAVSAAAEEQPGEGQDLTAEQGEERRPVGVHG